MEQKKINLTLILTLSLFAIGIAVKSLVTYFGGFGIPFVGVLVLAALVVFHGFLKSENRRRLWDILVLICINVLFALVAYCAFDWALDVTYKLWKFVNVWTNIYSVLSLIFLIYTAVRYISEASGKKFIIFEYILGTKKVQSKIKINQEKYNRQPREVKNGDLEEKPNQIQEETNNETKPEENIVEEVKTEQSETTNEL